MMGVDEHSSRVRRLIDLVRGQVDILFISSSVNLRYFAALSIETLERPLFLIIDVDGGGYIFGPELERSRVLEVCNTYGFEPIIYSDAESPYQKLRSILKGVERLGVESRIPYGVLRKIEDMYGGFEAKIIDPYITELRMVKSPYEVSLLERAANINQETMRFVIENIRVGVSERELSFEGCRYALSLGADSCPYPIIQSGPNTSLPHQTPTDRVIRSGDIVLIDFSITYEGYVSDITRVVRVGWDSRYLKLFELVRNAQELALSSVSPGVPARKIDLIARSVIGSMGYGELFIHRTGHGIGLEVHEEPYIHSGSEAILRPGMVFTIEPGVYIEGEYGIRLEDNVVVTRDGYKNLVNLPKELDVNEYKSPS